MDNRRNGDRSVRVTRRDLLGGGIAMTEQYDITILLLVRYHYSLHARTLICEPKLLNASSRTDDPLLEKLGSGLAQQLGQLRNIGSDTPCLIFPLLKRAIERHKAAAPNASLTQCLLLMRDTHG